MTGRMSTGVAESSDTFARPGPSGASRPHGPFAASPAQNDTRPKPRGWTRWNSSKTIRSKEAINALGPTSPSPSFSTGLKRRCESVSGVMKMISPRSPKRSCGSPESRCRRTSIPCARSGAAVSLVQAQIFLSTSPPASRRTADRHGCLLSGSEPVAAYRRAKTEEGRPFGEVIPLWWTPATTGVLTGLSRPGWLRGGRTPVRESKRAVPDP
jgi:hypothetical protein